MLPTPCSRRSQIGPPCGRVAWLRPPEAAHVDAHAVPKCLAGWSGTPEDPPEELPRSWVARPVRPPGHHQFPQDVSSERAEGNAGASPLGRLGNERDTDATAHQLQACVDVVDLDARAALEPGSREGTIDELPKRPVGRQVDELLCYHITEVNLPPRCQLMIGRAGEYEAIIVQRSDRDLRAGWIDQR